LDAAATFDDDFWAGALRRANKLVETSQVPTRDDADESATCDDPLATPIFGEDFWDGAFGRAEKFLATVDEHSLTKLANEVTDGNDTLVMPDAGSLQKLLMDCQDALTRSTLTRVLRVVHPLGGSFADPARERLRVEVRSIVFETCCEVLSATTFDGDQPRQVRAYVVKRAADKIIMALRHEWKTVSIDDDRAGTDQDSVSCWLARLTVGRPAEPLVAALRSYAQGAELSQIGVLIGSMGVNLSDGELVIELTRTLRHAKTGNHGLPEILQAALARLERYLMDPAQNLEIVVGLVRNHP
jgi:hypothetical protein